MNDRCNNVTRFKLSMATEVDQNTLIRALKELKRFGRTSLDNVENDVAKGILNNMRFCTSY